MFLPFKNLTSRQSAGYVVLCVAFGLGIKYMDDTSPQRDTFKTISDGLIWSDFEKQKDDKKRSEEYEVK
ncbi:uncharacterized protein PHALS_06806 [Plasmopara halstedii]|uniref:Uncharacterized protein n=1 Tax=Plasmopara halstedii TaxID=4781 RepID=A0A0P1B5Q1_PLAHL|nr:uncharacterized protein PHALS_06806 [Plasmopara halstedii]CEG49016.1 hypothetical protein PHALS_06806 [Plasmopara halstedii]|eukprot:XP_024585385.1 hypothetical protein PHALS_06806 [Plasmopara halstedii]